MVVIDEATQATEPSTLIPLVGIRLACMSCSVCNRNALRWTFFNEQCTSQVKGAECVVLAGDPLQLPPTVLSRRAGTEFGLTTTLFERSQGHGESNCLSGSPKTAATQHAT